MPTLTQAPTLGDLLKYEAPNLYSSERATVAAGQNLPLGAVVGRETATSKLKALDPAAGDGSDVVERQRPVEMAFDVPECLLGWIHGRRLS